jgi:hypothetical protein
MMLYAGYAIDCFTCKDGCCWGNFQGEFATKTGRDSTLSNWIHDTSWFLSDRIGMNF